MSVQIPLLVILLSQSASHFRRFVHVSPTKVLNVYLTVSHLVAIPVAWYSYVRTLDKQVWDNGFPVTFSPIVRYRGKDVYKNRPEEQIPDEAMLVQKAIGHDAHAFGRLYDMYIDRVYRHVYYRVGNEQDAEDLTQQVFLKAWQAIGRYKKTASPFIAWLITISHNLVVDFYRTRKDRAYLEAEVLASDPASSPEHTAEASLEQQRLRRAILQLGRDEQQVVILRFMEGFEFCEIASLLAKKEGNVRVILHRGLAKLHNILKKEREQR